MPVWIVAAAAIAALSTAVSGAGLSMQDLMAGLNSGQDGPNCDYLCADGTAPTKDKSGHVASSNGCGTDFLSVQEQGDRLGLTGCCNEHDVCYGSCGSTFQECEERFSACMGAACEARHPDAASDEGQECKSAAAMFSMGTRLGGCAVYKQTQRDACECAENGGPGEIQGRGGGKPKGKRRRAKRIKRRSAGGLPAEPAGLREEL